MDLLSLTLPLTPVSIPARFQLPQWWGRAAHALLLRVIDAADRPLADALHDESGPHAQPGPRPFTASTLMGAASPTASSTRAGSTPCA